ncbi:MAG TPA: hypothetical protein VFZ24_10670 [Longimicrobiales bacterium]
MGERIVRRVVRRALVPALLAAPAGACGEDPVIIVDRCEAVALPLSGSADAPVVTDVGLEVQTGIIVALATATDPQGSANLSNVIQRLGVFPDPPSCRESPLILQDDLAGSGVEESFGTVVDAAANPALFNAIAAAQEWPVDVDFADADGNRTTGRVRARVIP